MGWRRGGGKLEEDCESGAGVWLSLETRDRSTGTTDAIRAPKHLCTNKDYTAFKVWLLIQLHYNLNFVSYHGLRQHLILF